MQISWMLNWQTISKHKAKTNLKNVQGVMLSGGDSIHGRWTSGVCNPHSVSHNGERKSVCAC